MEPAPAACLPSATERRYHPVVMSTSQEPNVDVALRQAADHFSASPFGQSRYGWKRKSAGRAATLADGSTWWLRVQFADPTLVSKHIWNGEVAAGAIAGVDKPALREHYDWVAGGLLWRASLSSAAPCGASSPTPELRQPLRLDARWIEGLRGSLKRLAAFSTDRVSCGQEHLDAKIAKVFGGGLDTRVRQWMVCHGDLHWANVGWPEPIIFDWETWGRAPRGLDAARLALHAGLQPAVAADVLQAFADLLEGRDALIATLYVCADAIDMIRRFNYPPADVLPSVEAIARDTLARLVG